MNLLRLLSAAALLFLAGRATAYDSVVTFNEVHYHPTGPTEDGEWLELHNLNGVNVDLSGWRISGGIDFTFPSGTVIPGKGHLVIARNPAIASLPNALGPWSGALSNRGETLRLRDNNDRIMDELSYADSGSWPVAPDGSGATLAKTSGDSGSRDASSWTSSRNAGGSPGTVNFPPPTGPVTSSPAAYDSSWRFWNSSTPPAASWFLPAFNDASWPEGRAAFTFGSTSLYMDGPRISAGGVWSTLRWSSNADSTLSSNRSYTHKICLNRSAAINAINGVVFDLPGPGVTSGTNWSLLGATTGFNNNGNGTGANNLPANSGSRQLCEDFLYGASLPNATSRLELTGLTAGQSYTLTLFSTGFGGLEARRLRITPSDSNSPVQIDQNASNNGNGFLLKYLYKCPPSGTIAFDFLPVTAGASWHHYAFSNESTAALPDERPTPASVSIAGFSSQLTGTLTRGAVNTINGSGLTSATGIHGTSPEGTMWLSTGTFSGGTDPLPAFITFDLGAPTDLTSFRVWNYNELNLTSRGANQVEIQTATQPGGPFTTAATVNFSRAFGITSEIGQRIPLIASGIRQVRLNILSSHGGDNQFAGLSEIRFFSPGRPEDQPPPKLRVPIASLFNSGVGDDARPLPPGLADLHFSNTADSSPAVAMAPNPAWLGDDGLSRFIGFSGSGTDNAPAGSFTFRTSFSLADYVPGSAQISLYASADNSLDSVRLNGSAPVAGISAPAFNTYFGPFAILGPFNPGNNSIDFTWTNAGPGPNPGGLRLRWDSSAEPLWGRTTLPTNPTTTWFRRSFSLEGTPATNYSAVLRFAADDGAVFFLNGIEVHRFNLPAGPLTPATPASNDVLYPMISARIALDSSMLRAGPNVLAVELHQASSGTADAWFMASLDVTGTTPPASSASLRLDKVASALSPSFSLDLVNPTSAPLNLSGTIVRSSTGPEFALSGSLAPGATLSLSAAQLGFQPADGDKLFLLSDSGTTILDAVIVANRDKARTPSGSWAVPSSLNPGGTAVFSIPDSIVINEIMYHHQPVTLPTGTTNDPEEWIELLNRSTSPVDLSGWQIRGGIDFNFAPGTILQPGAFLVVSNNPTALASRFPGLTAIGPFSGSLSNSSDSIRLEDAVGNTADEVAYHSAGRWDSRADGSGASLELRDPDADNNFPESWAASDESARSTWQSVSFSGNGAPFTGTNDPTLYNELVLGLLNSGECLIDDVSVREVTSGNRELIQNGNFSSATTSWRLLGNHGSHGRSISQPDPSNSGNPVLRITATGGTEHMHNHIETTLRSGSTFVPLNPSATYAVSFRARWLSGSPRLLSRLYFNRLARQIILAVPMNNGTPGAPNSRATPNIGPSLSALAHLPVVPLPDQAVSVSVRASDPDGIASVVLRWRPDGAGTFSSTPMSGTSAFSAALPPQTAGSLLEFFIEATDNAGAVSRYPANGALVRWNDGTAPPGPGHGLRVLMTTANADFMHLPTNVMSNDTLPCTVIYKESEIFYNARCRLKSSQRGRLADVRLGFAIDFDPAQPFRGVMTTVNLDRSSYGRGSPGSGYGHGEIINWHFFSRASGIPSMYNDMVYLIAPRSAHTGSSTLTMAEFNDQYLDGQWDNGADTPTFKYELIYYPLTTEGSTPEGLKLPQPDEVNAVAIGQISSPDKEAYRWNFLIGNARNNDDFSRIVNLNSTFRLTGTPYAQALPSTIDVDQWLRCFAAFALAGPGDHYTTAGGGWHNLKLYHRRDGRILFLPWDGDFLTQPPDAALVLAPDLAKMIAASPAYHRAYYGHLNDIINRSFNEAYIAPWASHYQTFSTTGGNWSEITTYVAQRVAFVRSQIAPLYPATPFAITTNNGADFSVTTPQVTLSGTAPLDVRSLRINGADESATTTWTSRSIWSVSLPVAPGLNRYIIEAIAFDGTVAASDVITITGTGSIIPAAAGNLVISEFNYHPAPPSGPELAFPDNDDFEFIELLNISPSTISLNGVRFSSGITWNAPANITMAPGSRRILPRRTAAFNLRYPGIATLPEYFLPAANLLSNTGESLALIDAAGAVILSFSYSDRSPWPDADGTGPSLVLVAPSLNPDPSDPLNWRASRSPNGSPATSDAAPLPANPNGDDNNDGISNLMAYATGGTRPILSASGPGGTFEAVFVRAPGADVLTSVDSSPNLASWAPTPATLVSRSTQPDGSELLTLRSSLPPGESQRFLRLSFKSP